MTILYRILNMIRTRREELGISQQALAAKLDISRSAYGDIESGRTGMSIDRLMALSNELKLSPGHLLRGHKHIQFDFGKLFYVNEHPHWIFDPTDLKFLEVNNAALYSYGFSRADFMKMTIQDIRPEKDVPTMRANLALLKGDLIYDNPVVHWTRDRTERQMRVSCYLIEHENQSCYLVRSEPFHSPVTNSNDLEFHLLAAELGTASSDTQRQDIINRITKLFDKKSLN